MAKKVKFNISLQINILREGNRFVAHTPALDFSTSGKTLEEAYRRFNEAVKLFLEECYEAGTLDEVFKEMGWSKGDHQWQPPLIVSQRPETYSIGL